MQYMSWKIGRLSVPATTAISQLTVVAKFQQTCILSSLSCVVQIHVNTVNT